MSTTKIETGYGLGGYPMASRKIDGTAYEVSIIGAAGAEISYETTSDMSLTEDPENCPEFDELYTAVYEFAKDEGFITYDGSNWSTRGDDEE